MRSRSARDTETSGGSYNIEHWRQDVANVSNDEPVWEGFSGPPGSIIFGDDGDEDLVIHTNHEFLAEKRGRESVRSREWDPPDGFSLAMGLRGIKENLSSLNLGGVDEDFEIDTMLSRRSGFNALEGLTLPRGDEIEDSETRVLGGSDAEGDRRRLIPQSQKPVQDHWRGHTKDNRHKNSERVGGDSTVDEIQETGTCEDYMGRVRSRGSLHQSSGQWMKEDRDDVGSDNTADCGDGEGRDCEPESDYRCPKGASSVNSAYTDPNDGDDTSPRRGRNRIPSSRSSSKCYHMGSLHADGSDDSGDYIPHKSFSCSRSSGLSKNSVQMNDSHEGDEYRHSSQLADGSHPSEGHPSHSSSPAHGDADLPDAHFSRSKSPEPYGSLGNIKPKSGGWELLDVLDASDGIPKNCMFFNEPKSKNLHAQKILSQSKEDIPYRHGPPDFPLAVELEKMDKKERKKIMRGWERDRRENLRTGPWFREGRKSSSAEQSCHAGPPSRSPSPVGYSAPGTMTKGIDWMKQWTAGFFPWSRDHVEDAKVPSSELEEIYMHKNFPETSAKYQTWDCPCYRTNTDSGDTEDAIGVHSAPPETPISNHQDHDAHQCWNQSSLQTIKLSEPRKKLPFGCRLRLRVNSSGRLSCHILSPSSGITESPSDKPLNDGEPQLNYQKPNTESDDEVSPPPSSLKGGSSEFLEFKSTKSGVFTTDSMESASALARVRKAAQRKPRSCHDPMMHKDSSPISLDSNSGSSSRAPSPERAKLISSWNSSPENVRHSFARKERYATRRAERPTPLTAEALSRVPDSTKNKRKNNDDQVSYDTHTTISTWSTYQTSSVPSSSTASSVNLRLPSPTPKRFISHHPPGSQAWWLDLWWHEFWKWVVWWAEVARGSVRWAWWWVLGGWFNDPYQRIGVSLGLAMAFVAWVAWRPENGEGRRELEREKERQEGNWVGGVVRLRPERGG